MQASSPEPSGSFVARDTFVEILGYLGAAVALSAAGIALGQSAGTGVRIAFDVVTTGVLLVSGWALGADRDPLGRMRGVFWFLSVFGLADLSGALFGNAIGLTAKTLVLVVGLVVAAYSVALWMLSRRSLQAIAVFLAVLVTVDALAFPDIGAAIFGAPSFTGVAILSWLYGIAWIAAGFLGAARPRKTAVVLGSVVAIIGPLLLQAGGDSTTGQILSLATSVALLLIGERFAERGVAGVGIAGTLIVSAAIVGSNVHDQGPAIAVVIVGLALLGAAIAMVRATGSAQPPTPGVAPAPPPMPPAATPPGSEPTASPSPTPPPSDSGTASDVDEWK